MSQPIILLGGGRWARVLLKVLFSLNRAEHIIWVSSYGFAKNQDWLAEQKLTGVILRHYDEEIWDQGTKAVLVATDTARHARLLEQAVYHGIPVLCEKPFALDPAEAESLVEAASRKGLVAGVNLEFMYASYLHDFKDRLGGRALRSIDMSWHDPFHEIRHGEDKYGDVYTPLVHDTLPHCWSMLHILLKGAPVELTELEYDRSSQITLMAESAAVDLRITLNRRGQSRVRRISVNTDEAVLDFAQEPGSIAVSGHAPEHMSWTGLRPLGASLTAFLNAIEDPEQIYPSSIATCLQSVVLAQDAFVRAQAGFRRILLDLEQKGTLRADDPYVQNIFVDMLVPQLAIRPAVHTADEVERFCAEALTQRLWAR
jgi:predicted dehydrogenase